MNVLLSSDPAVVRRASQILRASGVAILKPDGTAGPNVFEILRRLIGDLTAGGVISLPFVGKTIDLSVASGNYDTLANALDRLKSAGAPGPIPEPEGNPEGVSDAAMRGRPPKSASAPLWVSWAVQFGVPLPHSKTSLVGRFR